VFIDCHAHLIIPPLPSEALEQVEVPIDLADYNPAYTSLEKIILQAQKNEVRYIVGVISHPEVLHHYPLQRQFRNVIHVLGISRGKAMEDQEKMINMLKDQIATEVPNAIGETGLEYQMGYNNPNKPAESFFKKKQKALFIKQLEIAKEWHLPVVIHAGAGTDHDLLKILKKEQIESIGGQIHGCKMREDRIKELINMNFYISFGLEHTVEPRLQELVKMTPVENILTETDSPYRLIGTPKHFIQPTDVAYITEKLADLKEMDLHDFKNQILQNARKLFNF
jgi:TatD DNase family protein